MCCDRVRPRRIVTLGSSVAVLVRGGADDEPRVSYTEVAARELASGGRTWESSNHGRWFERVPEGLDRWERDVAPLAPSVVVLNYGFVDCQTPPIPHGLHRRIIDWKPAPAPQSLTRPARRRAEQALGRWTPLVDRVLGARAHKVTPDHFVECLSTLVRISRRELGAAVVLLGVGEPGDWLSELMPSIADRTARYDALVRQVAASAGAPFIDVRRPELRPPDGIHLDPAGHRFLGASIARAIVGRGGGVTARDLIWALKARTPERWPALLRARWLVTRLRLSAAWHRATVDVDVAPDLLVGRSVRVEVEPFSHNVLRWGRRGTIGAGSVIRLTGGTIELGDDVQIRDRCVLNVGGRLVLEGRNVLSWAVALHCGDSVRIGDRTIVGEYTTITDSSHQYTAEDDWVLHHVAMRPVRIGDNCWICAKATIARGTTIGDHCIVAGNALVTGTVPDAHVVTGVPSEEPTPLRHPWTGTMTTISVVVPTVDRVMLLQRCLRGLAAQERPPEEVIVVHDGVPAVEALLRSWSDRLPLHPVRIDDRGAVAKRNAGWRAATGEVIAFTDDDCEPAPGWLSGVAAPAATHDLVHGPIRPHPEDADVTGLFARTLDHPGPTRTFPNANLAVRRAALDRVDGYDDAFWGGGEDTDLAWRVIESGGTAAFVDDALVWHAVRPASLRDHLRSLPRWQTLPLVLSRHPALRDQLHRRVFWKRSHPAAVLAAISVVAAVRDPRCLVGVVPLLVRRIREAGVGDGLQLALADLVEVAVVGSGSVRYRAVLL